MMKNATVITESHYPERNLAYIHAMDSYYTEDLSSETTSPEKNTVPFSLIVLEIIVLAVSVWGLTALIVIIQKRKRQFKE